MNENNGVVGRRYEITPRAATVGGGWKLTLFEDGEEVGGGVFPSKDDSQTSLLQAYEDALNEGESWIRFGDLSPITLRP